MVAQICLRGSVGSMILSKAALLQLSVSVNKQTNKQTWTDANKQANISCFPQLFVARSSLCWSAAMMPHVSVPVEFHELHAWDLCLWSVPVEL